MASEGDLLALPATELLAQLAGGEAEPGAGASAALCAAIAAALVAKAARASAGSWPEAAGMAAQAEALRARVTSLAAENAAAHEAALSALALVHEGRGPGDEALADALDAAAAVPLRLADDAAATAELAAEAARHSAPELRPEAIGAAEIAAAAARAAALLVEVNLTAIEGDERVGRAQSVADAARTAAERALGSGG